MRDKLTTRLSSKEIDILISEYRSGSIEAATKLLEVFRPLIGKYLKLFFHGAYSPQDQDVVKFLHICGKINIEKTADIIRAKLRRYDADELINIARISLLETAKKYDNISSSYKYILYGYLRNMLWEDFLDAIDISEVVDYPAPSKSVSINEDWIKGTTAGDGFSELTEKQRLIIKLCYNDGIPDVHTAKLVGMTAHALAKEKQVIKAILAKELNIKELLNETIQ